MEKRAYKFLQKLKIAKTTEIVLYALVNQIGKFKMEIYAIC